MSIRSFHNIFCPTCDKDTLHFVQKCTECGAVVMTGGEQWKATQRRIARAPFRKKRVAKAIATTRQARREITLQRVELFELQTARTSGRDSVFGKGRARQRA